MLFTNILLRVLIRGEIMNVFTRLTKKEFVRMFIESQEEGPRLKRKRSVRKFGEIIIPKKRKW